MKNTFSFLFQRKSLISGLLAGILLFGTILYFTRIDSEEDEIGAEPKPHVSLSSANTYAGGAEINLIGTVRALNEAEISADRGGRVTSVNAKLNDKIVAGAIIVTLENSSERASVLQAEGAYEATLASASQTSISTDEATIALTNAKRTAVTNLKDVYNVTNGVVLNSIDQFFSEPNSPLIGLKIEGRGYTSQLNTERLAYQSLLPEWKSRVDAVTTASDLEAEIQYSSMNIKRTIDFVDTFLTVFNIQSNNSRYSETELNNFRTDFTNLRSSLLTLVTKLDSNLTSIDSAVAGVERAKVSASGGQASVADAGVKQALGVLRAAQANLAKTILRTPISGTVNNISVKAGDFVTAFTPLAKVANNSALEVVTYAGDLELKSLTVGTSVSIDNRSKGVVSQIAPAIDSATAKTEVRIVTEDSANIKNGTTVKLGLLATTTNQITSSEIKVPITAIKFETDDAYVYQVRDGKLVEKSITLGNITGSSVIVTSGLQADEEFVVDVRGLLPGTEVVIK